MTQEYILSLDDSRASLENTGGKGASLARLANAGLPVPGGFHITTAAYRQFLSENDLQAPLLAALQPVDTSRPETLETASAAIRRLFEQAAMPAEIAAAIARAYQALPWENPAVAVRSSATAEDLPGLSFAGQQETFLNVQGSAALQEAVKRCWASLWTARAIGYRIQHGIDQSSVGDSPLIAVIVQLLVPAEAAGIMFTANPVNGRRDQITITAAWGLGEAIVGGLVNPDTLVVEKESGQVFERDTADKQVMTTRVEGGSEEVATPEALRRVPVLNDQQAAGLARLGVQIEKLYGMPMDIEWAFAGGQFAILQARPVTALPEPELPAPTDWTMPNPKATYMRGSMAEHLPNPVSPLFGTLGLRLANIATLELFHNKLGVNPQDIDYEYLPINGYTFIGLTMDFKFLRTMVKSMFKAGLSQVWELFSTGIQRWQDARRSLAQVVAKWDARPVASLSPSELLEGAREIMLESGRFYTVLQSGTLPISSTSEILFTRLYSTVRRKGEPEGNVLLFGFDTSALRADKSLFDLAEWVRARPAFREYVLHTPADDLAAGMRHEQPPENISEQDWSGWKSRFENYLSEFGHTSYEFDFANATPAETPETLLELVKAHLDSKASNPYERQHGAIETRERLTQEILSRRTLLPKSWLKRSLRWAQDTAPAREESIADMGMGYPSMRQLLGELGRRFAARGAITVADDIYWLLEDEVNRLAAGLESDETLPDLSARISSRKAEWRARLKVVPPALLPENSRWRKFIPWAGTAVEETEAGQILKGVGASAGRVTAPACVIIGPEEFGNMKPGDVLVAVTTTPAWTPLFSMASAVVTDIGGPLSHSSIVAREYGIPAVMATGIATRTIQSGDLITVDGGAGVVTLPKNGS